jgi:nucleotide-binding universal stress UspA family protein
MKTTPRTKRTARSARRKPASLKRTAAASADDVIEMVPRVLGLRRILVPVDFSTSAEKALRYAVSFAQQFDAKITLLHVRPLAYYPSEMGGFPVVVPAAEPPTDKIQARLNADASRLIPQELRDRALLRTGTAFDEICKAARKSRADLIIIATHGHTGLKHVVLGSTAERVVRHAPCPVLVVRAHEHEFA